MPPIAAMRGNKAFLKFESSPMYISLSISRPTKRKKMVIKPSFIQNSRGLLAISVCQKCKYCSLKLELESSNERAVQKMRINPDVFSLSKNSLNSTVNFINYKCEISTHQSDISLLHQNMTICRDEFDEINKNIRRE